MHSIRVVCGLKNNLPCSDVVGLNKIQLFNMGGRGSGQSTEAYIRNGDKEDALMFL